MSQATIGNVPREPGWYWFQADARTVAYTGYARLGVWAVVLVGESARGTGRLVVRFPWETMDVSDMGGIWSERIFPPVSVAVGSPG
jgi:hypothetical protein